MSTHPHDDVDRETRRPEWWNGISTGNILTMVVMLASAASVYATNEGRSARLEERVNQLEQANIRQDTDAMRQADKIEARLDKIEKRLDDILAAVRIR